MNLWIFTDCLVSIIYGFQKRAVLQNYKDSQERYQILYGQKQKKQILILYTQDFQKNSN